jgi:hypothetical protein
MGWIKRAYEVFLGWPVPRVLAVLWFAGVVLLGASVLALYRLVTVVARMLS